jgi:hypothetical protein
MVSTPRKPPLSSHPHPQHLTIALVALAFGIWVFSTTDGEERWARSFVLLLIDAPVTFWFLLWEPPYILASLVIFVGGGAFWAALGYTIARSGLPALHRSDERSRRRLIIASVLLGLGCISAVLAAAFEIDNAAIRLLAMGSPFYVTVWLLVLVIRSYRRLAVGVVLLHSVFVALYLMWAFASADSIEQRVRTSVLLYVDFPIMILVAICDPSPPIQIALCFLLGDVVWSMIAVGLARLYDGLLTPENKIGFNARVNP